MKQKLVICLLALLPFFAAAQDEAPPLIKDFYEGTHAIPESFILNDHVNIMEFKNGSEDYSIMAIDDQMQTLWNTPIQGNVINASKFKDKVLVVTSTEFSNTRGNNNTFKAYLLDPSNGKILIEKVIFDGPQEYLVFPFVFTGEGNIFKFAVRQSGFERGLHVGLMDVFSLISLNKYYKQYRETKDFDVIDFNEKLEPVTKIKVAKNAGSFLDMTANNQGDLFINWFDNGSMNILRYDSGKSNPSSQLACNITVEDAVLHQLNDNILLSPSKKNSNVLYYSLVFRNADKEMELGIGKLDFSTGKKQYENELLTRDAIKSLQKSYVPVNKKMDSPDLGYVRGLDVRMLSEFGDRVVVSLTSQVVTASSNYVSVTEYNVLLNAYDTDLKLKYQQLVPTSYSASIALPIGYHYHNNKLYVISNDKHRLTYYATYSVFDLATGQCDKMYPLTKRKIGSDDAAAGSSVLWFENDFVVPYLDKKMLSVSKYNVSLQQNSY